MKKTVAFVIFGLLTLSIATAQRLPERARPENYKLKFTRILKTRSLKAMKPSPSAYKSLPPRSR